MVEQLQMDLDSDNLVVQDNNMIMGKYDMSALEQKIMLILISTIKKDDTEIKQTTFKVRDVAEVIGICADNLYRELPKTCKSLIKKTVEIKKEDGSWEIFNIITYAEYKKGLGTITLEINRKAYPYLLELNKLFTTFKLGNALTLSSKYSIRLYQMCKSFLFKKEHTINLSEFKDTMVITRKSYNRFNTLNERVISPSIKEINEKTDLIVNCSNVKIGKSVVALKFNVSQTRNRTIIKQQNNSGIKNSGFNNFTGREYDFDKLEKGLLGLDSDVNIEDVTLKR